MHKTPSLSIGLPVYNGAQYLDEQLRSLQSQTIEDFEIVISDNASTDDTERVCREYAARDKRIRYFRSERNLGANPNFNRVFALSRAPLFKWATHDDLLKPTYLETCIGLLDANSDAVLAHSDYLCIDESGVPFPELPSSSGMRVDPRSGMISKLDPLGLADKGWSVHRLWDVLFRMECLTSIFGVIRRDALTRTGLMRNFYGTDKLLLAELALLGRFKQSHERLYLQRFHNNMSWTLNKEERKTWSNSSDGRYSLRLRQLTAFSAAPFGKALPATDAACAILIVSLLGPRVVLKALRGHERLRQAKVATWRWPDKQLGMPTPRKTRDDDLTMA